jgi:alpha-L-fucosidase
VEELLTWYAPIREIWFDGGVLRPEKGGPDVVSLVNRVAPELICFGGCPGLRNVLRWSGSEQGVAVPECWSAAHYLTSPERDNVTCDSPGDPDDPLWAPVEVDMPVRDVLFSDMAAWMYMDGKEAATYSGDYLFARYLTSVGRNANLLIGCLPNRLGLISEDQQKSFRELGDRVRRELGIHLAQATVPDAEGTLEIRFPQPVDVRYAEFTEEIADGQKVLEWVLETRWPEFWCEKDGVDRWIPLAQGQSVGHKRIVPLEAVRGYAFRIRVLKSKPGAKLSAFRLYGKHVYD